MLKAIADGETNPTALAALADKKLRATQEQLRDALSACTELNSVYRRLLKMTLEELQLPRSADQNQVDHESASLLKLACGCRAPAGGGPRSGSGFGAADPGRSGG